MNKSVLRTTTVSLVLVAVLFGSAGCSLLKPPRDAAGQLTATATLSADQLRTGDCLLDINSTGNTVTKLTAVPCTTPHNGEVYATGIDPQASDTTVADQFCSDRFEPYVGVSIDDTSLDVSYIYPQSSSDTSKTITCIISHADGTQETSSLKGSQQ